jgi:hypothetical protein
VRNVVCGGDIIFDMGQIASKVFFLEDGIIETVIFVETRDGHSGEISNEVKRINKVYR